MTWIKTRARFSPDNDISELINTEPEYEWEDFCFNTNRIESFNTYREANACNIRFKSRVNMVVAMTFDELEQALNKD